MKTFVKISLWILAVAALIAIPASEGRIFNSVKDMLGGPPPPEAALKDVVHVTAEEPLPVDKSARTRAVPAEQAEAAKSGFERGLKFFQDEKYPQAWEEWLAAEKLDPNNMDIRTGLKRLEGISPKTRPE